MLDITNQVFRKQRHHLFLRPQSVEVFMMIPSV